MTTTEIAVRENGHAPLAERDIVDGWVEVVTKVAKLADMIADTDFVPKALRNKPAAIAACILTGREIGVGPMLSLKVIHLVNGVPSLAAEYKRARALERGHEIVYEETSITRCVVRGRRRGEDTWATVTWTMDDARRAKLQNKDVWQQNPRRMLEARATGELCDLKFPDCSWGLATTEALQDGDVAEFADSGTPAAGQPAADAPAPGPRQARRRTAPAAGDDAKPETAAKPAPRRSAPPPPQDTGLPPLPGEEEDPGPAAQPGEAGAAGPGTTSKHQHLVGIVRAHFKRLGFEDHERDQRLATTAVIAGVPADLATTTDLTEEQLSAVADTLARCRDRERLIVLLTKRDKPRDS